MNSNAVLFGGFPNPVFDEFYLISVVFGRIVFMVYVIPGGPDMLRRIDWVLFIGWISEGNIAVFIGAPGRRNIVAFINFCVRCHGLYGLISLKNGPQSPIVYWL